MGFFVHTYFITVYFITTYLLSFFSILFDSSVINTDTHNGIITNLLGYFFICLGISIISTYSWKLEINVSFYTSNFICKYDSFSFQSVIFSLLFIVMVFTLTLLVILNSNYWLCFIIIFNVYDSKIHFIYAITFIFRFLFLNVNSSHLVAASLFFSQNNGVVSLSPLLIVIVLFSFLIAHECDHLFG